MGSSQYRWQAKSTVTPSEIKAIASIAALIALAIAITLSILPDDIEWQLRVKVFVISFCVSFVASVLVAYYIERAWLPQLEEVTNRDIDGNGIIGASPNTVHTKETILVNRGESVKLYRIPGSNAQIIEGKLIRFLEGVEDSDGLTFAAAQSAGLTRREWDSVIDAGVKLSLWSPKSQGVDSELQTGGDDVMSAFFPS